jgi:hypothetical protein
VCGSVNPTRESKRCQQLRQVHTHRAGPMDAAEADEWRGGIGARQELLRLDSDSGASD